jgi:hypothetical protein
MRFRGRSVITENIERFEVLLRDGRLNHRHIVAVQARLAQARAELAVWDSQNRAAAAGLALPSPHGVA